MKYMKLGSKPDTFYTEDATRSVLSDVPSDLTIHINNTKYLLHKFPLLLKCGLLQRLCPDSVDLSSPSPIELHDIPGGEEAFEVCAKFCYGITISLSAYNIVPTLCAAKFLRMTESIARGNLVPKLEAFLDACVVHGWKDSVVALHASDGVHAWSENLGIIRRCTESIIDKILTHPSKVTWSYTYTRPGYSERPHRSVPKDWWTEDISEISIDHFSSIISAVRSAKKLHPGLIGEALHVYAYKNLPEPPNADRMEEEALAKHRRMLESIVSMIPSEPGSVSGRFLLRLLKVARYMEASPSTKAELVRRSGRQLDEATVSELLFPADPSSAGRPFNVDLVGEILESFMVRFRHRMGVPMGQEDREAMVKSMSRVARLIDLYLQEIASDPSVPSSKIFDLVEACPEFARQEHDHLYRAIDAYLKGHPELNKAEKKRLCSVLDCRKLSKDARMHAIRNDRLPLRTVVQLLFIEQEESPGDPMMQTTARRDGKSTQLVEDREGQRERGGPSSSVMKVDDKMEKHMAKVNARVVDRLERLEEKAITEEVEKKKEDMNLRNEGGSGSKVKVKTRTR
ncbi:BTB/POZ domain-containing protein [Acorus calamus]|uniref:BTB/POZ domain-containing protein n=1 Tax=Acorus calamus TaxID=4465 RepID=A0AAV9D7F1_ACOCL|nr:BTB/POZ domain-containing protein [Acorus calamus]